MKSGNRIPNNPSNPPLEECIRAIRLVAFDFDGVFTDNLVYVFEDGSEAVRCFRGDGIGLRKLERLGIATIIISAETNPVVSARSRKLGIRCVQACGDKRAALETLRQEMSLSWAQVAFVGNDINDLPCLTCVGLPIVVQDAHLDESPTPDTKRGHGVVTGPCVRSVICSKVC